MKSVRSETQTFSSINYFEETNLPSQKTQNKTKQANSPLSFSIRLHLFSLKPTELLQKHVKNPLPPSPLPLIQC